MGLSAYLQQRHDNALNDWPSQMAKGPMRWIAANMLRIGAFYALVFVPTMIARFNESHGDRWFLLEVVGTFVFLLIGSFWGARSNWRLHNLSYFQRTGDLVAKANADAIEEEPVAPFAMMIVPFGLLIAWGWWSVVRGSGAPFAWVVLLLALGITASFALLAYRSLVAMIARR